MQNFPTRNLRLTLSETLSLDCYFLVGNFCDSTKISLNIANVVYKWYKEITGDKTRTTLCMCHARMIDG